MTRRRFKTLKAAKVTYCYHFMDGSFQNATRRMIERGPLESLLETTCFRDELGISRDIESSRRTAVVHALTDLGGRAGFNALVA